MQQEEELLLQQSQINRSQYEINTADTNNNLSVSTKYLGYDPELRLAKLQDTIGNIFYGQANTNGAIARGEDIRLRRGYGIPGYDAMPYKSPKQPIGKLKKPLPPTFYTVGYGKSWNFFLLRFAQTTFTEEFNPGSLQEIAVSTNIGFTNEAYLGFTYFSFEPFLPLLTHRSSVSITFFNLKKLESAKISLQISTSYSLKNLAVAYFVNKGGARIVESVPSPLNVSLSRNNISIFNEYGESAFGEREIELELQAADFSGNTADSKSVTFLLDSYIRAQSSVFYGGVGANTAATISHSIKVKIESINNKKVNLQRKNL